MYCAYITTIKNIRKHNNADRLQCTTIFGNNVIVDLSYQIGDRVVFFPTDGQLSKEFAEENNLVRKKDENGNNIGGYLDAAKRNITALKLRGEKSEGLILPIKVLEKYVDVDELKDGDKITVLNGQEICRKYIPNASNKRNKKITQYNGERIKNDFPFFEQHIDTAQLAYNESAFRPGDICYITLKMHGTSGRTANTVKVETRKRNKLLKKLFKLKDKKKVSYDFISGTRRVNLTTFEGGYHGSNAFREKYHNFFKERLPKGVEIFYEIVGYTEGGQTIMGKCKNKLVKDKDFTKQYGNETIFTYGCDVGENKIYVYRMTMTNEDGFKIELPWEQVQAECERMGVECVPTFEKFIFTTWEDLMQRVEKYYDGVDPIGKTHIREGIVVRIDNRNSFTAYKHKNFEFKVISGIITDSLSSEEASNIDEDILSEM